LPIGHEASAWVYRVVTDDRAIYFLKVRKGLVDPVSVAVPRAVREAGATGVVAPISSTSPDALIEAIGEYSLIVYPFVEGRTAMARGLSDRQWVEYGAMLRAIHRTQLPGALTDKLPRETFGSTWALGVRRIQEELERRADSDPFVGELAAIWREHRGQIARVLRQTDLLGRQLRDRDHELVLCHTDPHLNNVLVDGQGRLFMVDWDTPLLSPKERDLHFVIATVIGSLPIGRREEDLILRGYGFTPIDWAALLYFRNDWICGDLLTLAECVVTTGAAGAYTRSDAIGWTRSMFEPGRAVASAAELERRAPRSR
jgi:spectinomycin phosphotransferase